MINIFRARIYIHSMSHPLNSFENNYFEQCFGGTRVLFQIIVHSVGRVCYPYTALRNSDLEGTNDSPLQDSISAYAQLQRKLL